MALKTFDKMYHIPVIFIYHWSKQVSDMATLKGGSKGM